MTIAQTFTRANADDYEGVMRTKQGQGASQHTAWVDGAQHAVCSFNIQLENRMFFASGRGHRTLRDRQREERIFQQKVETRIERGSYPSCFKRISSSRYSMFCWAQIRITCVHSPQILQHHRPDSLIPQVSDQLSCRRNRMLHFLSRRT